MAHKTLAAVFVQELGMLCNEGEDLGLAPRCAGVPSRRPGSPQSADPAKIQMAM
jgi:hypothetical protein